MSLVAENCELRSYFYAEDGPIDVVHGATSAYDRRLLLLAPGDAGGLLSEDAVFTILLNLAGKDAKFVDLPLVSYRQHAGAISNTSRIHLNNSVDDSRSLLEKEQRYSKNIVDRAKLALHSENMPGLKARRLNKAALWEDILLHGAKCNWSNLSFANRFHALAVAFRKRRIGFLLPSILGKRLGPRYLSLRLRSKDLDELKSFMHRYLNIKNYAGYARRRSFWLFKRVLLLGSNVHIAINADISPLCSIVPGKGSIRIGAYSVIQRGAVLRNYGSKIEIGRHSTIGHNCVLYSGADLIVGEGVRIGPLTAIIAGNHRFEDREIPIYLQGMKNRGVKIDDDVWIGAGAKILAGVSIGHGAVVAAGAVVTRSVREWEIVAGVPARVIGVRGNK
jgi:acetyltransferase-like isoleucine patch superfamily enzyme